MKPDSRTALLLALIALVGVIALTLQRRTPIEDPNVVAEVTPLTADSRRQTADGSPSQAQDQTADSSRQFPETIPTPTLTLTPSPTLTPSLTPTITPTVPTPTETRRPSPTPEPWPEPLSAPGQSKIGLHVTVNSDPRAMEFVRRVKPSLIFAIGDTGFLAEVKAVSPSTVTIARYDDADYSVIGRVSPEEWAHTFVDQHLERYRLNPGVDYWEGWNEYRPLDPAAWDWYTRFEAERARYMDSLGLRAAVGTLSTGVPEWGEMANFIPALRAARDSGGIFTLHEYAAPTLYCGVGAGPADAPILSGVETGALTLRYRYWYESYLKPQGLGDLRLAITEAGIDGIARQEVCGGPPGFGWKDYVSYWAEAGFGDDSSTAYLEQIKWYDSRVRQDSYVIGFALFTMGAVGSPNHSTYDLHDMAIPLAQYMATQK